MNRLSDASIEHVEHPLGLAEGAERKPVEGATLVGGEVGEHVIGGGGKDRVAAVEGGPRCRRG